MILYPTRIKNNNSGDILINVLLIRELSKHSMVILDGEPLFDKGLLTFENPHSNNIKVVEGIYWLHGKPILRWFNLFPYLLKINQVFDPPGAYGISSGLSRIKLYLKFMKYFVRARLLKRLGIKTIRFGVSYQKMIPSQLRREIALSKYYSFIGVRDKENFKDLVSFGFENIHLVDDLAFLYDRSIFVRSIDLQSSVDFTNYILFSFRGAVSGDAIDLEYLNGLVIKLIEISRKFQSDKHLLLTYQVKEDFEVMKFIEESLRKNNISTLLIDKQLDVENAAVIYSNADFIFTNRLHVALLGLLNETLTYVLTDKAKHKKICGIYCDLGIENLIIDSRKNNIIVFNPATDNVYGSFYKLKEKRKDQLGEIILKLIRSNEN